MPALIFILQSTVVVIGADDALVLRERAALTGRLAVSELLIRTSVDARMLPAPIAKDLIAIVNELRRDGSSPSSEVTRLGRELQAQYDLEVSAG